MTGLAKLLIVMGLAIVLMGIFVLIMAKLAPGRGGLLPGDIVVRRGNFTFYFPIVTSIVISLVLTLILYLLARTR